MKRRAFLGAIVAAVTMPALNARAIERAAPDNHSRVLEEMAKARWAVMERIVNPPLIIVPAELAEQYITYGSASWLVTTTGLRPLPMLQKEQP